MSWTTINPKIEEFKKLHKEMRGLLLTHLISRIIPIVAGALCVILGYFLAWQVFLSQYNILK